MLVAADIGGTKTDLAIFSGEAGVHVPLAQERVHIADYPSLQAMVKEFIAKAGKPLDRACFAVAGTVIGGRVEDHEFADRLAKRQAQGDEKRW